MLREEYLKKDEEISQCMAAAVDLDSMSLSAHAHVVKTENDDATISSAEESYEEDDDNESEEDEDNNEDEECSDGKGFNDVVDEMISLEGPLKGFAVPNLPTTVHDAHHSIVPPSQGTDQGNSNIHCFYTYETDFKSTASVYTYEEDIDMEDNASVPVTKNCNVVLAGKAPAMNANSTTLRSVGESEGNYSPKLKYAKIGTESNREDSEQQIIIHNGDSDIHSVVLKPLVSISDKNVVEEYVLSDDELLAMLESLESNGILVPATDPQSACELTKQPYISALDSSNKENNPGFVNLNQSAQNHFHGDPTYMKNNSETKSAMLRRYTYYPIHESEIGNGIETTTYKQSENGSIETFTSPNGKARDCFGDVRRNDAVEIYIRTTSTKKRLTDGRATKVLLSETIDHVQPYVTDEELLLALEYLEGSSVQYPSSVAQNVPESFVAKNIYSCHEQQFISTDSSEAMVVEDPMPKFELVGRNESRRVAVFADQNAASPSVKIENSTTAKDKSRMLSVSREREKWRTVSPYLTPFTASKVRTPGKYLYYPYSSQKALGNKTLLDVLRLKYSATSFDSSVPVYSIDVDMQAHEESNKPQTAKCKHASDNVHCGEFLQRLATARCVSFELIYRRYFHISEIY